MKIEKKSLDFKFETKSFDDTDSEYFRVSGLAGAFSKDLADDVIEPGAFKKSLQKRLPKILFDHDSSMPIGMTEEAYETEKGLFIKFKLPKDDTFVSGRVIPQIKAGSLDSMSIGFSMTRDDYEVKNNTRYIKNMDLFETSLVVFPCNPDAKVEGFKSVGASRSLELADKSVEWDGTKAVNDIRKHTGSDENPSSDYKKYFFWYDADNADNFTAYKMPFAADVGGELKAIPAGVNAAFAALSGARGGLNIPSSDKSKVESAINTYRKKMGVGEFDESEKSMFDYDEVKNIENRRDFERLLRDSGLFSKKAATYLASNWTEKQSDSVDHNDDELNNKLDAVLNQLESISINNALKNFKF